MSWGGAREGAGRKAGIPNKNNQQLRDMILNALDKSGGEDYLVEQAQKNPTAFLTLIGKVLPTTIAGDKNNPINSTSRIEVVLVRSENRDT
jgi:hypothetical protein